MGAFILSGLVFAATLAVCALIIGADSMSDAPSQDGTSPVPFFVVGTIISIVICLSHWAPHIGW